MGNIKKNLWILIAIIMILFAASPGTVKYLRAKTSRGKGKISTIREIETPHSNQIIYKKFDRGLIKYQKGVLIYYDTVGKQLWSVNLAINRPVIKTNSNSIYIIDENKNQIFRFNKKGEQLYKKTLDKSYKNFSICDDNYAVLHHDTEDMVQHITVMNEKGENISEIVLSEGDITNMSISGAYDKIAVSTLDTNEDKLKNNILIYDLNADLLSSENFGDSIILDIFYSETGDLIVIDEKNILSIDEDNRVNWQTDFDDNITIADTKNKNFITIYSKGNKKGSIIYSPGKNTIKILSYNGKLLGEAEQEEEIIDTDSYKNNIMAYSLRTVFKYNKSGNLMIEYPYNSDILKCYMLSDDNIVVITREKISFLSFKK